MRQQHAVRVLCTVLLLASLSRYFNPVSDVTATAATMSQHGSVDEPADETPSWQVDGLTRDPCKAVGKVQFDGVAANSSVGWQVGLGSRTVGSNASAALRGSVLENLTEWGWNATESAHLVTFPNGSTEVATNLVATLPAAARLADDVSEVPRVVIAAHYDSRPTADMDPNESRRSEPIPGANDGASGVAVLLELGRVLPMANLSVEIVLLFTDVEDHGEPLLFMGAQRWADNLSQPEVVRTNAFVLLDMVGDGDLGIAAEPLNSDSGLMRLLLSMAAPFGAHATIPDCGGLPAIQPRVTSNDSLGIHDDHLVVKGMFPAALLIDVSYGPPAPTNSLGGYWHTHDDTPDKVSAESLGLVGGMVELALRSGLGEQRLPSDARASDQQAGSNGIGSDSDAGVDVAEPPHASRGLDIAITAALTAICLDVLIRRRRAVERARSRMSDDESGSPSAAEGSQDIDGQPAPEEE